MFYTDKQNTNWSNICCSDTILASVYETEAMAYYSHYVFVKMFNEVHWGNMSGDWSS